VTKDDLDHAELDLKEFDESLHSNAFMSIKAGKHVFRIDGEGTSTLQGRRQNTGEVFL
jgi:hypothetical protein